LPEPALATCPAAELALDGVAYAERDLKLLVKVHSCLASLASAQSYSMIRIAVIADIHGNLPALEAVAADFGRRGVTRVANLGDHASGPLWPEETVTFLMQQSWVHIAGNCDRRLVSQPPWEHGASERFAFERLTSEHKEWLASLPATAIESDDVLAFHGTPTDDETYLLELVTGGAARLAPPSTVNRRLGAAARAVNLCAHSHSPRIVRVDGRLIVNPGSVGLPAYVHDVPEQHVMETGAPDARYAILEQSASGDWLAELVAVPYNHRVAADAARRNGRTDWELALNTGYAVDHHA
jgi:predicted phosphodiesterase